MDVFDEEANGNLAQKSPKKKRHFKHKRRSGTFLSTETLEEPDERTNDMSSHRHSRMRSHGRDRKVEFPRSDGSLEVLNQESTEWESRQHHQRIRHNQDRGTATFVIKKRKT